MHCCRRRRQQHYTHAMARCCLRCSTTALVAFVWLGLAAAVAAVWQQAAAVGVQGLAIGAAAAAAVYVAGSARSDAFEPPTPQRGAAHALALSALWWLAGLALVAGDAEAQAACPGRAYVSRQAAWLAVAAAAGAAAVLVTAYALVRLCTENCVARVKRDRLARRRRRAAQDQQPHGGGGTQQTMLGNASVRMDSLYTKA